MKVSVKGLITLVLMILFASVVSAQNLQSVNVVPQIDGTAAPSEYPMSTLVNGMRLFASLSADRQTLYLAITAPTTGWAALGPGASRMNGALLILGYDDRSAPGGLTREDTGRGWSHSPSRDKILLASAVQEIDGLTTLEIALPAERFLVKPELEIMLAYGPRDNFTGKHTAYGVAKLTVPAITAP